MIKLVSYTILLLLLLAAPSQAALIFHQEWESSTNLDLSSTSMSPGFHCTNQCKSGDSVMTNNVRARNGSSSVRFFVDSGDLGSRVRCTMDTVDTSTIDGKSVLPYDSDRWFGFSVYIPADSSHKSHGVMNMHQRNWGASECINSDSPPIGFNIAGPASLGGNNYEWQLKYHGRPIAQYNANADIGKWTDWVFQVNMSFSGNGKVLIWKNGVSVRTDYNFTLAGTNTPASCGHIYPKISAGMLSGSSWAPMYAWQDSHRWGDENSSFAEVDPAQSGSNPPPGDDPPPEDDPPPTSTSVEAETGNLSGSMVIFNDSNASGGSYTRTRGIGQGIAEFTVNAETAGLYKLKGRVYAWSEDNKTLFVSVEGGQEQEWIMNIEYQKWVDATYPQTFNLSKGTHTIQFRGENDSARLDYFTIENVKQVLISMPTGFQIVQ